MAYAAEVGAGPGETAAPAGAPAGEEGSARPAAGEQPEGHRGPGPAESSGRLWVPGR